MKGHTLFLMGLVATAVGVVLILFRNSLANGGVVIAAGIIFLLAGILNVTVFLGARDRSGRSRAGAIGTTLGWVASGAAVVLGLAMLMFKGAFVAIVGFMFAVLLLFAALFQIFLLLFGTRPVRLSSWFFLVPTALIAGALFIFLRKPDSAGEHLVMLVSGIAFVVFGVFTIVEGGAVGQSNRQAIEAGKAAASIKAPAKDDGPKETGLKG